MPQARRTSAICSATRGAGTFTLLDLQEFLLRPFLVIADLRADRAHLVRGDRRGLVAPLLADIRQHVRDLVATPRLSVDPLAAGYDFYSGTDVSAAFVGFQKEGTLDFQNLSPVTCPLA